MRRTNNGLNNAISPSHNKVYVFGSGDCGQLGLGEEVEGLGIPTLVPFFNDKNIIQISAGGLHNLALSAAGLVYSWGCNDEKALGHVSPEWTIGQVTLLEHVKVVKIACGDSISAALTNDGQVYTWGTFRDSKGVMGHSENTLVQAEPTLLTHLSPYKIIDITAGANHLLALSADSQLFSWGCGEQGQLGRRILERHKLKGLMPQNVTPRRKRHVSGSFSSVTCGSYHSLSLRADGQLFAWGLNNYGQLGCQDTEPRIIPDEVHQPPGCHFIAIAAGEHHSLAVSQQGTVYTWGRGDSGQLGTGTLEHVMIPTPIRLDPTDKVLMIASGGNHCLAVTQGNQLYAWGFGEMNQLGTNREQDEISPKKITTFKCNKYIQINAGGQHSILLAQN